MEPKSRREIRGGQFQPLSAGDIIKIHNASLEVLERAGIKCPNPEILKLLRDAGAYIKGGDRVCFSRWLVENSLFKAPSRISLCGRDPRHDLILEGTRVHVGTGGSAINVIDLETGKRRPALLSDMVNMARLADALDNIDFFMRPLFPSDVPLDVVDIIKWYAAFQNTSKHVMGSAFFAGSADAAIRMAEIIQGGARKLRERPIISFIVCWLQSPLSMAEPNTGILVEIIKKRIPVVLSSAPMAGTTAPVTLAGTLVQMNAELLSGIALSQIISPGCPVIYGAVPSIVDMRTMSFAGGAVETGLLNAAAAQLAHHYEIPIYNTAGITDSKLSDVQAGYEKAFSCVGAAMGGGNIIHDAAGMLESTMTVSYRQCVIDNEIVGMLKRMLKGIDVSEKTMAVDTICSAGLEGHYVSDSHTAEYMRSELYYPAVSDRQNYEEWVSLGARDAGEKAKQIAVQILENHRPEGLALKTSKKIETEFRDVLMPYMDRIKAAHKAKVR